MGWFSRETELSEQEKSIQDILEQLCMNSKAQIDYSINTAEWLIEGISCRVLIDSVGITISREGLVYTRRLSSGVLDRFKSIVATEYANRVQRRKELLLSSELNLLSELKEEVKATENENQGYSGMWKIKMKE